MAKRRITIDGIDIDLERKRVKNVNFTIYPPDGRVRVSAPQRMDEGKLRQVILSKLPWIKRHQSRLAHAKRADPPAYLSGENHAYLGRFYRLEVRCRQAPPEVAWGENGTLEISVRDLSSRDQRERLLYEWYRRELKALIPPIITRWEPVIGVEVAEWGVRRMKTRWGSCSIKAGRIWLNLELIKYPASILEYIIVHEMVHLLERRHNDRFYRFMDTFMPDWRERRDALRAPQNGLSDRID